MLAALFSHRLPWPCPSNRLSRLLQLTRNRGAPILDLTESNPTRVGLDYPVEEDAPGDEREVMGQVQAEKHAPHSVGVVE